MTRDPAKIIADYEWLVDRVYLATFPDEPASPPIRSAPEYEAAKVRVMDDDSLALQVPWATILGDEPHLMSVQHEPGVPARVGSASEEDFQWWLVRQRDIAERERRASVERARATIETQERAELARLKRKYEESEG